MYTNLKDTCELMCSDDWRERFLAEYRQLETRLYKLDTLIEEYQYGVLEFELTCPISLLRHQRNSMRSYLQDLKKRATIEEIDLYE